MSENQWCVGQAVCPRMDATRMANLAEPITRTHPLTRCAYEKDIINAKKQLCKKSKRKVILEHHHQMLDCSIDIYYDG